MLDELLAAIHANGTVNRLLSSVIGVTKVGPGSQGSSQLLLYIQAEPVVRYARAHR